MLSAYSYEELLLELQRKNINSYFGKLNETSLETAWRRFVRAEYQLDRFCVFIDEMRFNGVDVSVAERTMEVLKSSVNVLYGIFIREQKRMAQAHRFISM